MAIASSACRGHDRPMRAARTEQNRKAAYRAALNGIEHKHTAIGGPVTVTADDGSTVTAEAFLNRVEEEIRGLTQHMISNCCRVGELLENVKGRLGYGRYTHFVETRLRWSVRTAYNFRRVFKVFGSATVAELDGLKLDMRSVYALASPAVKEHARATAIATAANRAAAQKLKEELVQQQQDDAERSALQTARESGDADRLGLDRPDVIAARRALGRFRREFRASFGQVPSLSKLCYEVDQFVTAKQLELAERPRPSRSQRQ